MSRDDDPLVSPPPREVPLPDAPLVRVIAQVRFSTVLSIRRPESVVPFQEAVRGVYPVLRQERSPTPALDPSSSTGGATETIWRFSDAEGEWLASLTPEFVALETKRYTSRSDFLTRFDELVRVLEKTFEPPLRRRLGLRYIDRIEGNAFADIEGLVRPEMLGLMVTTLAPHVEHAIGDTLVDLPKSRERLRIRWGRVPPQATVDPSAIEAIDEPSWILDLDMFSTEERRFSAASILGDARRYAERLYAVFRWAVTEEFLARYGGRP